MGNLLWIGAGVVAAVLLAACQLWRRFHRQEPEKDRPAAVQAKVSTDRVKNAVDELRRTATAVVAGIDGNLIDTLILFLEDLETLGDNEITATILSSIINAIDTTLEINGLSPCLDENESGLLQTLREKADALANLLRPHDGSPEEAEPAFTEKADALDEAVQAVLDYVQDGLENLRDTIAAQRNYRYADFTPLAIATLKESAFEATQECSDGTLVALLQAVITAADAAVEAHPYTVAANRLRGALVAFSSAADAVMDHLYDPTALEALHAAISEASALAANLPLLYSATEAVEQEVKQHPTT